MLLKESLWVKEAIEKYVPAEGMILNIGSSTAEFVDMHQPYIQENIYNTLKKKNISIKNIDIKDAPGVDIVGDVCEDETIGKIEALKPNAILCSNLLEHITDRDKFINALRQIQLPAGSVLIVTVPCKFPYHPDPIDTMFRPAPAELDRLFVPLKKVLSAEVKDGLLISHYVRYYNPVKKMISLAKGLVAYALAPLGGKRAEAFRANFMTISATCGVYRYP